MTKVVDALLLEDVAGMKPSTNKDQSQNYFNPGREEFALADWIESHDIQVRREGAWNGKGHKWVLEECPWNGHADNAAFIVRFPNGAIAAGCHHNSCQEYGWRDLREFYEPGCYDKLDAGGYGGNHRVGYASDLENEVGTSLPQVPPFPTWVLPRSLRRLVEEAAASIGCPPEFIAVPMLATLGAAIGNSVVLEAKVGYTQSATLYAAIVGDPGTAKTPAFLLATAPAQRKQEELVRRYKEAMAEYNRERNEDLLSEPTVEPTFRRTVVQDTTTEALAERLAENPKSLLISNDEISGWVRSMDQYKGGKGNDRQVYLSLWSNSSVTVDRKGRREPLIVFRPFVSIAGGIQPGVLSEIKNSREDGLLDRFLFAYPNRVPSRWSEDEISAGTMAAYQRIYNELYGLGVRTDENGVPDPRHATFMPSAKEAFVEAINSLGEEAERPDFPAHLRGPWSKMGAYLLRLSLVIGMASIAEFTSRKQGEFPEFMKAEPVITVKHVKAAIALVEYFKAHAQRVYAKLDNSRVKSTEGTYGNHADKELGISEYLVRFVGERGGYWEGTTSALYEILKEDSVLGLAGGAGAFGKQVRKVVNDPDNALVFAEGWRGKEPVIKLSLPTPGTFGDAEGTGTKTTKRTESSNEGEGDTADQDGHHVHEGVSLAEILDAIERLFDEHPDSVGESDAEMIGAELFWWDYLDCIPDEEEVREALNQYTASAEQSI